MTALKTYLAGRVAINVGDITKEAVDAIVNAANGTLMGGGGVDGAIHRAGGPEIKAACAEIRRAQYPAGFANRRRGDNHRWKITGQACDPHRRSGLRQRRCGQGGSVGGVLFQFVESGGVDQLKSIAFPAISTGVYGYPMDKAAAVSSRTIEQFLSVDKSIDAVKLVFFSAGDAEEFLKHHSFTRAKKAMASPFWIFDFAIRGTNT